MAFFVVRRICSQPMDTQTIQFELAQFQREFESYLNKVTIQESGPSVIIETREGDDHRVSVSECGWQVFGDSQRYETSQGMISAISPMFRQEWSTRLFAKVRALNQMPGV